MNRLGYRPDPPKTTDYALLAEHLSTMTLPASVSLQANVVEVLDQGHLGSCVAQAAAQALRIRHAAQGVKDPYLASRLFIYYWARTLDGVPQYDVGTHLRSAFDGLNSFGFPPESEWPYSDQGELFAKLPNWNSRRAAFDQHTPTTYRRIYETGWDRLDVVKRAVASGFPVCFGTDVSKDFVNNRHVANIAQMPPSDGNVAGGHAMCIMGYSGDVLRVVNSWSTFWGEGGYFNLSPDYLAWDRTRDLWVVEHTPIEGEV